MYVYQNDRFTVLENWSAPAGHLARYLPDDVRLIQEKDIDYNEDLVMVNTSNSFVPCIPMLPVKWDMRVKGQSCPDAVGSSKAMWEVIRLTGQASRENLKPVSISVFGSDWRVWVNADAEIAADQAKLRELRAERTAAKAKDRREEQDYSRYDMARVYG